MKTRFNFQINPDSNRKIWDDVPVIVKFIADRGEAVQLAKKSAKLFKAEVRLTEGINPLNKSGAYFYYLSE